MILYFQFFILTVFAYECWSLNNELKPGEKIL